MGLSYTIAVALAILSSAISLYSLFDTFRPQSQQKA